MARRYVLNSISRRSVHPTSAATDAHYADALDHLTRKVRFRCRCCVLHDLNVRHGRGDDNRCKNKRKNKPPTLISSTRHHSVPFAGTYSEKDKQSVLGGLCREHAHVPLTHGQIALSYLLPTLRDRAYDDEDRSLNR